MLAGLEGAKKEGGVRDRPRKAGWEEFEEDEAVRLLGVVSMFMKGVFSSIAVSYELKASL